MLLVFLEEFFFQETNVLFPPPDSEPLPFPCVIEVAFVSVFQDEREGGRLENTRNIGEFSLPEENSLKIDQMRFRGALDWGV